MDTHHRCELGYEYLAALELRSDAVFKEYCLLQGIGVHDGHVQQSAFNYFFGHQLEHSLRSAS